MALEFALQTSGTYQEVIAAARWAEMRGLAAVALPDHYLMATDEEQAKTAPAPDAFAHLAGLARETTDIELIVLVSPITFRHPAVLVKAAVTIDDMSDGRFTLGVGTGWMDKEHAVFGFPYPDRHERFAMLEDALGYIRAAFDPAAPGYEGTYYRLEPFPLAPVARPPRIVVGGTGRHKTPTLAGRFADELNAYPAPPDEWAAKVATARRAATEAGRDPGDVMLSSSAALLMGETEDEFRRKLESFASRRGTTPDDVMAHLARRNAPHGTYEAVRRQLVAMEEAGMQRFYLQTLGEFDPAEMDRTLAGLGGIA